MKRNGVKIVVMICISIVVVFGSLIYYNGSDRIHARKQMDLGDKYLEELDYDKAIAAYEAAIKIDPRNEKPNSGLDEIYIKKGDYKIAKEIFRRGYAEKLMQGLNETNAELVRIRAEETERQRIQEIMEELYLYMESGDDKKLFNYVCNIPDVAWEFNEKGGYDLVSGLYGSYSRTGDIKNGIVLEAKGSKFYYGEKIDGCYRDTGKKYSITAFSDCGYMYYWKYEGDWQNGMPEGEGCLSYVDYCDGKVNGCTMWIGTFSNGYYSEEIMEKRYYNDYYSNPYEYTEYRYNTNWDEYVWTGYSREHSSNGEISDWRTSIIIRHDNDQLNAIW